MQLTKIFTLHETIRNRPADALARLFLVSVIAGTVEKTIAGLDRSINRLE